MAREDFLSLPDLVRQARDLGLDVSERTVRFYVARGLLPAPVRQPFPEADGRVAWYPAEALRRLRRIGQLKAQGLSLEQIARVMAHKGGEALRRLSEGDSATGTREVALRYLQAMGGEEARRARLEFLAAVTGTAREDLLLRAVRRYLVRRLAVLVGEAEAARHVEEWLMALPPAELQRRLEPFRRWRDQEREREQAGQGAPLQWLRRLAGDRLLNLVAGPEFATRLQSVQERLEESAASLPAEDPPGAAPLAGPAARGLGLLRRGLAGLLEAGSGADPDAGALARALDQVQRGEQALRHVAEAARRHAALLDLE